MTVSYVVYIHCLLLFLPFFFFFLFLFTKLNFDLQNFQWCEYLDSEQLRNEKFIIRSESKQVRVLFSVPCQLGKWKRMKRKTETES